MKSMAQHKLEGTYKPYRHSKKLETEQLLSTTAFEEGTVLVPPSELTDDYVIQCFKTHTTQLISFHLLSPQDIPELTLMYLTLQQLRQIYEKLKTVDIIEDLETYTQLTNTTVRLGNRFSELAKRYYISPTARAKIQLDAATIQEKKQILEQKSSTGKLLANKRQ